MPRDFEPACHLQAAAAAVASACVLQATVPGLVASWTLLHLKVLQQVDLPVHFAWWSRSHHAAVVVDAASASPVFATSVAAAAVESGSADVAVVEASNATAAVLTGSAEFAAG